MLVFLHWGKEYERDGWNEDVGHYGYLGPNLQPVNGVVFSVVMRLKKHSLVHH